MFKSVDCHENWYADLLGPEKNIYFPCLILKNPSFYYKIDAYVCGEEGKATFLFQIF